MNNGSLYEAKLFSKYFFSYYNSSKYKNTNIGNFAGVHRCKSLLPFTSIDTINTVLFPEVYFLGNRVMVFWNYFGVILTTAGNSPGQWEKQVTFFFFFLVFSWCFFTHGWLIERPVPRSDHRDALLERETEWFKSPKPTRRVGWS